MGFRRPASGLLKIVFAKVNAPAAVSLSRFRDVRFRRNRKNGGLGAGMPAKDKDNYGITLIYKKARVNF